MFKVAILVEKSLADSLFLKKDLEFLGTFAQFNPVEELPAKITLEFMDEKLENADACITCWRTPTFTKELLDRHPKLRFIMHGAGAVRNLVCPEFWDMKGRHISSNAPIIAKDVAQTTLAFMMPSLKQFWQMSAMIRSGMWKGGEAGNFTTMNVDKDLNIINAQNLPLIRDGAVFINTARGLEVDETALIEELKKGRFFACLDVTSPEPPAMDNPLRTLPNVILTPHMAGGHAMQNRSLMGRNAIKEVYNYLTKGLIAYEVRGEMLSHMA